MRKRGGGKERRRKKGGREGKKERKEERSLCFILCFSVSEHFSSVSSSRYFVFASHFLLSSLSCPSCCSSSLSLLSLFTSSTREFSGVSFSFLFSLQITCFCVDFQMAESWSVEKGVYLAYYAAVWCAYTLTIKGSKDEDGKVILSSFQYSC